MAARTSQFPGGPVVVLTTRNVSQFPGGPVIVQNVPAPRRVHVKQAVNRASTY